MIALVEGAQRQKTPNEIALNILIAGLDAHLPAGGRHAAAVRALQRRRRPGPAPCRRVAVLVSLLVCLIPTTIGGLLSAIGIAGMDRVMQHNVLAMSGKAVEAAGDVNTLLLDKTGTITLGNRQAVEFIPVDGVTDRGTGRCGAAVEPGRRDAGRPLRRRARQGEVRPARPRRIASTRRTFIPFSAYTRMSGVDFDGRQLRKGATDAIATFVKERGGDGARRTSRRSRDRIARSGGTPLAVADGTRAARASSISRTSSRAA